MTIQVYDEEQVYSNIFLNTFQEKMSRKSTFSKLLKKSTIMGRKLSVFSRQKKPELKLMIPLSLERKDSNSTDSSSSDEEVNTPTNETFNIISELETTITTPSDNNRTDYSGNGYSNFYIKLPNGNWMVRVRDKNRKIIGTFEMDGSMI